MSVIALLLKKESSKSHYIEYPFGKNDFCQLIFTIIDRSYCTFDTIYGSNCTILTNFYIYLQYFQQKVFNFSKINESQTDI